MICVSMQPSLCTTQSYSSSTSSPTLRSTTRFSLCSGSERGRKPDSQQKQHSNIHIRTHTHEQSHDCGLTVSKAGTPTVSRHNTVTTTSARTHGCSFYCDPRVSKTGTVIVARHNTGSTYNCSVGVEIDTCSGDGQSRAAGDAAVARRDRRHTQLGRIIAGGVSC